MMKTYTFSVTLFLAVGIAIASLFSCSEDDNREVPDKRLIGKWELIEILADPGDGSGTFHSTDFYKTIEFFNDGKLIVTNGRLCRIDINSDETTTDAYVVEGNSILTDGCEEVGFEFEEGNLIIRQFCIEGCAEKYKRVK